MVDNDASLCGEIGAMLLSVFICSHRSLPVIRCLINFGADLEAKYNGRNAVQASEAELELECSYLLRHCKLYSKEEIRSEGQARILREITRCIKDALMRKYRRRER
jgi:hypothetical protein